MKKTQVSAVFLLTRAMLMALIAVVFMPLAGFAQEEHHQHEHHQHPKYAAIKNPVPMTGTSIAQGKKLYEEHCLVCHGEVGKGGIGPDLTASDRIHGNTDGEMFQVIADGVAGTAMKGFKEELPDELRWHLVNYIKGLKQSNRTK